MSLVVSSVWPALPTRAAFPACFTASNFCFLPLRACLLPGLSKPTGQASPPPPARTAAAQKPKHGERPHTICAASWRNAGQAGGRAKWLRSNWVSEQRLVQRRGQTLRKSSCGRGTKRRRRRSICIMQAAGMMERGHRSARPPRKRAGPFISRVPFATTGIATHAAPVRSHRGLLAALLAAPVASTVAAGAQAPGAARGFARDRLLRRLRGPSQEPRSPRRGGGRRPAAPPACSVRSSCEGLGPPPSRAA